MIRNTLTLLACGGLVTLFACSSDDVGEKYPSADSFCTAKAEAECKGVAAQCGATEEACKEKRVAVCNTAANTASGAGRKYKASAAENCIEKTRALYDLKTIPPDKEAEAQEICERVFEGLKALSERCEGTYDCKSGLVCDKTVCAERVVKQASQPCNNPGEVCEKGSYCGAQGDLKFCLPKKNRDEICSPDVPCKEELRCVGSCKDKYQPGDVCGTSDECSDAAPFCDPVQKRCIAKSFAAGTAACKDFGGF